MHLILLLSLFVVSSMALTAPSTTTSRRAYARAQIRDYVQEHHSDTTSSGLDDEQLGELIARLQSTTDGSPSSRTFDPESVAGMWCVIHAPHIAFLSKLFARFSPIEYHLTQDPLSKAPGSC